MFKGKKIGFGITGSFCSMEDMLTSLQMLVDLHGDVYVFVSNSIVNYDTRFNKSNELIEKIESITSNSINYDLVVAENYGPKIQLDVMVVCPCSGNTLSKIVNGINDNAVTMACKATRRNDKDVVLAIYTNDGLSTSGKNIMDVLNRKGFYLVPLVQDDIIKKPFSLIANNERFIDTIQSALKQQQIQPVFEGCKK